MPIRLLLIGGFLGAGKTTLLARAATWLRAQGHRVGVITNDQAEDLVDTAALQQASLDVREIAGGCFCCRFDQLIDTAQRLVDAVSPEIIIGEPVGSCTDLSATVLQPIKDRYAERYRLAPLSVLVDPHRLWEVLEPRRQSPLHASARYILRKQLEEADLIVINKVDLLDAAEQQEVLQATAEAFPGKPVYRISATTGAGVAEWLAAVLQAEKAGRQIVEVDYDVYAEGEAVLGWLNASARVMAAHDVDWQAFCREILQRIRAAAEQRRTEVAHAKLSLTTPGGQYLANLTSTAKTPVVRGEIDGHPRAANLVINARVEMTPEALQALIGEVLQAVAGDGMTITVDTLRSLSPGRPTPTHRYTAVVDEGAA